MKNIEKLKINIINYIKNPMDKYALLLDGNWGSGKTYAINNIKNEYNESYYTNDNKKDKIIYISLNGESNIDEVFYKCSLNPILNRKDDTKLKTGVKKTLSVGKNVINGLGEHFLGFDLNDLFSPFQYILSKSKEIDLIIFDDLERCKCDIDEIFGYVDKLLNSGIKVLLISDISKLPNKENYENIKEKIIGNTIEWKADYDSIESIINNIKCDEFKEQNLNIFKNIFLLLKEDMFIIQEQNMETKKFEKKQKINLRLLNKTIAHSIYIINLLDCGKKDNIELLYKEIIKNVYVHFHIETYSIEIKNMKEYIKNNNKNYDFYIMNDSSQMAKIDLKFVKDYFDDTNFIEKERYSKIINELLKNDKDLEFLFNDKINDFILTTKAKKIIQNINNYPLYCYSNIVNILLNIDLCLNTNYLEQIKSDLINNIKIDNDIIYCFNNDNSNFLHWKNNNKQQKIIDDINFELKKHNRKIAYDMLIKYLFNPYEINDYMDIFKDKLYVESNKCGFGNYELIKFLSTKINNQKLLNHLFIHQNYGLYFTYIYKLIHCIVPEGDKYIKKLNKKIEKIKNNQNDKYFKTYLNREINTIKNKYK